MFALSPSENEFTITLLSSNSLEKFVENVQSSFTNYLQSSLIFSPGDWCVGVTEIFHNAFIPSFAKTEINNQEEHIDAIHTSQPIPHDLMYINCDIIEDRIIGDQRVKCLKVLPTLSATEQIIRFGRIEYYPVGVCHIRSISIIISDQEGKLINFKKSIVPTMITLHFRKINKSI